MILIQPTSNVTSVAVTNSSVSSRHTPNARFLSILEMSGFVHSRFLLDSVETILNRATPERSYLLAALESRKVDRFEEHMMMKLDTIGTEGNDHKVEIVYDTSGSAADEGRHRFAAVDPVLLTPPLSFSKPDCLRGLCSAIAVKLPKTRKFDMGFACIGLGLPNTLTTWDLINETLVVQDLPEQFGTTFDRIYSGAGLIMLEKASEDETLVVISNPFNHSQRLLAPILGFSESEIMGILWDPYTQSYKIPVFKRKLNDMDFAHVSLQVYDSATGGWDFKGHWTNKLHVNFVSAAFVMGTFFVLTCDEGAFLSGDNKQAFHAYYLFEDEWYELELPAALSLYGYPAIFEYQGNLVIGCGHCDSTQPRALHLGEPSFSKTLGERMRTVGIWVYDWVLLRWNLVSMMRQSWVPKLLNCNHFPYTCTFKILSAGNFVCISSSNGKSAVFDMFTKKWTWLPDSLDMNLNVRVDESSLLLLEYRPDQLA